MLWLCIYLPYLPLDVFQQDSRDIEPFAIVEESYVFAANRAALQGGVRVGMRLASALALLPRLDCRERAQGVEERALGRLAAWSLQFTSRISLQPPGSLLLEIGGSLRYFGGLEALRGRLRQGLEALGYQHVLAIAPTPTAACLLARDGREQAVIRQRGLPEALAELPIRALELDARQRDALDDLGLHTLGDCLNQPREGLARRFRPELVHQLDRALGRLPDPRRNWQAPPRFRGEQELPTEVHDSERLLFGLNRLILELCGYLRGIESGTQQFQIRLYHRRRPATLFSVGLIAPGRDPGHLLELTRQRLERLRLPAPVLGLALVTDRIQHLPPSHRNLVAADHRDDPARWRALLERLAARLGEPAVRGLQVRAEHRPERAWQYAAPGGKSPVATPAERPLWLLPRPLPLKTHSGQPAWHGPLILHHGPERIESGWWDGEDVARDYYIAGNASGERVWLFRERRGERAWYLHGVFA